MKGFSLIYLKPTFIYEKKINYQLFARSYSFFSKL